MRSETEHDETGSFGETDEVRLPVWKRPIWGISPTMWGGCAILLLAAIWYLFLNTPTTGQQSDPPFNDMNNNMQTWQSPASSTSPVMETDLPQPSASASDMNQLARDLKTELDDRDEKIQGTLNMLRDSINKLSEAIKKDEDYAQETRHQLDEIRTRLNGVINQKTTAETTSVSHSPVKKAPSPVAGMKIMSMENGMAWIRWQGSTWAVREGDKLGKIIITRIDPDSRTIITSGGTLR
ncbi:conjugal transfer protein TraP [Salmonella enterica subsp. enterica serovar Oranienburg]|uniref:Conjugal transfer protein TraP n=1 Tax=Salmonella oranienberg TaxID=28147 RepID=A0A5I4QC73_SALON|nr:conjugal transfer protein TraP [Salmonella enterica subsp. enterica serovar Oranienburg]EBW4447575.1 conjugal transfer protein TraP [Salmonella enterica subsp. enterica serovar Arechavaleta]EBV2922480.1 conjugal transfer protein TraP [Salmonella enterica subsp. enterica serovar Oranienburg]EBY7642252.1 conjugal transfer protein TraP [Salmonella enterica subsp. enterica serovar Oranienburg]ECG3957746.1 conjugal transfer protein TraP [Salmonella enterica subsp. enterica serovar Oranienburg]